MLVPELFRTIQDFTQKKLLIDWQKVWEEEDFQRSMFESIQVIQQSLALMHDGDQQGRINLIGRLSFIASHLDFACSISNDETRFFSVSQELETLLRDLINHGSWLSLAQQRYDAFIKYSAEQAQQESANPDVEHMMYLQPVLLAIGIAALITFDQEGDEDFFELCSDECEDTECESHEEEELGA